jgi:hypothetical protein
MSLRPQAPPTVPEETRRAAKSRPVANVLMGGASAAIAVAVM